MKVLATCAKRSLHTWCQKIDCPSSIFRLPPVRKIIDFCEGDLEGASLLLSTGSLNLWFWAIGKWIAVNEDSSYRKHFRDLFWGRLLWPFWRKLSKTQYDHNRPYPVGVWVPNQWSPNWRAATYERETLVHVDFPRGTADGKKCFAPLPRTVYLV